MKALLVFPISIALLACPLRAQDTTSAAVDTGYVEYSEPLITLPLGIGLRFPSYDRVNGLSAPWGPQLLTNDESVELNAIVTYRSHLGNWDPSFDGFVRPGAANEIKLYAGRGTFTNDGWIRPDLYNSAATIWIGSDAANYYRADRATLRFTRLLTVGSVGLSPFVAGNIERDWSTGSIQPTNGPWSFFDRTDSLKMFRPNPPVTEGHINSILAGSGFQISRGGLEGKLDVSVEHGFDSGEQCTQPPSGTSSCTPIISAFTQTTIHSTVKFPTFGAQTFAFRGHAVLAGGDILPKQRWVYLGGSGTLATVNQLAIGGDNLLLLQGDYIIPIERIQLKFLGSPFLAIRYMAATAGAGTLPTLIQNIGVGTGLRFLQLDYTLDPASNRSPFSRRSAVSWGFSLTF